MESPSSVTRSPFAKGAAGLDAPQTHIDADTSAAKKQLADLQQAGQQTQAALAEGKPGDRRAALCKELTKLNEKVEYSTLGALYERVAAEENVRGEYVLVVEGYTANDEDMFWHSLTVEEHVAHYMNEGLSKMDAMKAAASDRNVGKGEIYKIMNKKE